LPAGTGRYWDADWSEGPDFNAGGGHTVIRQSSNGVDGPEPHSLAGIGTCDVNVLRGSFLSEVHDNAPKHF
jgi:hypothetical protein